MITTLDRLYQTGELKQMVGSGFLNPCVLMWRNLYHAYNARLEATGSVMQAMEEVATNFDVSVRTVQIVRKRLQDQESVS